MGRRRFRLKLNCVSIARVLSASSSRSKSSSASIKYGNMMSEFPSIGQDDSSCDENGNKMMVVVNSRFEAKCAIDWALSHAVQSQDTVLLLHVLKTSSQGEECGEKLNLKTYQLLLDMKNMCQMKRPGVQVKVVKVEGEEQGKAIVEEAKQQRVSLLVIGQRKRTLWWGFVRRFWVSERAASSSSASASSGVADYCIQNASCMTIAVRRKNKKLGGYLITTKRHKNFWLLA